jgi:anti-sigma regulatory factor (Ser/Thr protein kinase)
MIVAAVALEAISCTMYFTSRAAIKQKAEQLAAMELRQAELEIEAQTIELETAAKTLVELAERHLNEPDSIFTATRTAVRTLRENTSVAVAFVPNYYPKKGAFYEVCSSRITEDSIYTRNIGSAEHDYTTMEWFKNGFEHDSCWWSEPYMDDSGSKTMVVSCSCPVYDKKGNVVAVVCIDLALDYLQSKLPEYLKVYENSYYSIRSSKGDDIASYIDTTAGQKYNIFNEEIDATGWHIEIIIPEEELFRDLNRIGRIVGFLMILGLLVLGVIIWHTTYTVKQLMRTREQNQRMESELEIAKTIQMAMLPKNGTDTGDTQSTDIWGFLQPAKEVGGDLYDFYERDGKLFFCIGDVSGKGVPAALVMATTRSLFRSISAHEQDPAKLMGLINNAMMDTNDQGMFVTLFIGVLDLQSGEMKYCNAGHNAPMIMANGEWQMVQVKANIPIGVVADYAYEAQAKTLLRGDTLFLYTDGLTEAENEQHEQFGESRMGERLKANGESLAVKEIVEGMYGGAKTFVGEAEQSDDLTMLAIRWLKYSLVMRNDIQQIPTLAEWIDTLPIPAELNMPINLAIEEAVTNVMLYAYPNSSGKVIVEFHPPMTFTITDSGIPFDPTKKPEVDISLSAEEREIGGLGIHLVRQIMDEVKYERKNNQNILTLVKQL